MTVFRASARTVDMLGRQQIAGIPTAISELFKNAHDAYASRVEVDFLRWNDIFVLRDDGIGMSRDDFEGRWLTLGTESKLGTSALALPTPLPGKRRRPLLGEKGIGRLAIAAIGPQVLVMTRAYSADGSAPLVASFVNWSLFEAPGVRLDEINVPIAVLTPGVLPTKAQVAALVEEVQASLGSVGPRLGEGELARIHQQLDSFSEIDPAELDQDLGEPSLRTGHGTQFIITPTDESLRAAIAEPTDPYRTSPIRKALVGFTNTMEAEPDVIASAFRDHLTTDSYDELIAEGAFFDRDEFASADHHIEGTFDEFGQFRGTITVYGTAPMPHIVPWQPAAGQRTDCGPFRLRLAVVQGERRNSLLPADDWSRLIAKLNKIGGLYVYRNGIRVLPYGDADVDWVDIEFRRTKSASYYYFSYRRIFGYVDIDEKNHNLVEKAGREGFRENRAYRQFKEILSNFFVQTAADFFREGGSEANQWQGIREELDRKEKIRQKRERQARVRRSEFEERLAEAGKAINSGDIDADADAILGRLNRELAAASTIESMDEVAKAFSAAEQRARTEIAKIRERYRVSAPRGFAIPRGLRRDFELHKVDWEKIEQSTLLPAMAMIEAAVTEASKERIGAVDRRRRLEESIRDVIDEARHETRIGTRGATEALEDVQRRVAELRQESNAELDRTISEIQVQIAAADVASMTDEEFVQRRSELEESIIGLAERERDTLLAVAEQLQNVRWGDGEGPDSAVDIAEALEDELLVLRERTEEDLELAQLGMAVGVINHEFDASIRGVRANLRRLKSWADVNQPLLELYQSLRASFDHLDGYLTLFTPLQRRLYRQRVTITGAEIEEFLRELFGRRLARHEVRLTATRDFRTHQLEGYPSTFYPVFVNLVDNAIFWLSDVPQPRSIKLALDNDAMLVQDSGPGVPIRDRDVIFDRGFTRRPGGQGLGLYIARAVLEREGYTLEHRESSSGAVFAIAQVTDAPHEEGDGSEA